MISVIETTYRSLRRVFSRTTWIGKLLGVKPPALAGSTTSIPAPHYQRGLILIQIDGLGRIELERAMRGGQMPFLCSLPNRQNYVIRELFSGLPSSTPSVQAELFYGLRTAVPAFAFLDNASGRLQRMYDPHSASVIEDALPKTVNTLLQGGSAYSNIYTGGADDAHFCVSSMGWGDLLAGVRPWAWLVAGILYSPMLIRAFVLAVIEVLLAVMDAVRGSFSGKNIPAEWKFIATRVGINILLRDVITIGARVDIARGLPIVHLNYLGYDEQAHRRGPDSWFAHWALKGIDRRIRQIWSACHQATGRHYDLWIYSLSSIFCRV